MTTQQAAATHTNSNPFGAAPGAPLLGEVIAWTLPPKTIISHTTLTAALSAAGLDPAAARHLCTRHAFVRAVKRLAAKRIVRKVEEDRYRICFQFTAEFLQAAQLHYSFEAQVCLDKGTGTIMSTDAGLEALAKAELAFCLDARGTTDLTRLIQSIFGKEADLFTVKPGVYFVPQMHATLLGQVKAFVTSLGGALTRLPVPAGTPQGNASVQVVVSDGLWDMLREYEEAISKIDCTTRDKTLDRTRKLLDKVRQKIWNYKQYLEGAEIKMFDQAAWLEKLLRDREEELRQAREAAEVA